MNTIILAVIAVLGLYLPALTHSGDPPPQDILILTDEQGEYPLGRYMDILEDPDGELTIEEVASPEYEGGVLSAARKISRTMAIPIRYTGSACEFGMRPTRLTTGSWRLLIQI